MAPRARPLVRTTSGVYLFKRCHHGTENGTAYLKDSAPDVQAQKKRVEAILAEEETIDGLENVEVKVFK